MHQTVVEVREPFSPDHQHDHKEAPYTSDQCAQDRLGSALEPKLLSIQPTSAAIGEPTGLAKGRLQPVGSQTNEISSRPSLVGAHEHDTLECSEHDTTELVRLILGTERAFLLMGGLFDSSDKPSGGDSLGSGSGIQVVVSSVDSRFGSRLQRSP
jgi:hypothetical protein